MINILILSIYSAFNILPFLETSSSLIPNLLYLSSEPV